MKNSPFSPSYFRTSSSAASPAAAAQALPAAAASPAASPAAAVISVPNTRICKFQSFLQGAGIPSNGFNAAGWPGHRWHRITISCFFDLDDFTQTRAYCELGYVWLPVCWTIERTHAALLSTYSGSFLLQGDEDPEHQRRSYTLATD